MTLIAYAQNEGLDGRDPKRYLAMTIFAPPIELILAIASDKPGEVTRVETNLPLASLTALAKYIRERGADICSEALLMCVDPVEGNLSGLVDVIPHIQAAARRGGRFVLLYAGSAAKRGSVEDTSKDGDVIFAEYIDLKQVHASLASPDTTPLCLKEIVAKTPALVVFRSRVSVWFRQPALYIWTLKRDKTHYPTLLADLKRLLEEGHNEGPQDWAPERLQEVARRNSRFITAAWLAELLRLLVAEADRHRRSPEGTIKKLPILFTHGPGDCALVHYDAVVKRLPGLDFKRPADFHEGKIFPLRECAYCRVASGRLRRCGGCKTVYYCDAHHLAWDRPHHMEWCKKRRAEVDHKAAMQAEREKEKREQEEAMRRAQEEPYSALFDVDD